MKKRFVGFLIYVIIFSSAVFGQDIDRTQYRAIDPFDYRLDENGAARGSIRRFASVVRFVSVNNVGNNVVFAFSSLDGSTSLDTRVAGQINMPVPDQIVTIYFTATNRVTDTRVLDYIDHANTTESGIGVVKSAVAVQTGFNRADYQDIDPFDYMMDVVFTEEGEIRKYRSTVQFSSQDGITYFFSSVDPEQATRLRMRASRRFPPLTEGQMVTVYYTAQRGFLDALTLDYLVF